MASWDDQQASIPATAILRQIRALVWFGMSRTLTRYLRAPAEVVPGTKMIFFGLKKSQDVADVIAYLRQFDLDGKQSDRPEARLEHSGEISYPLAG